MERLKGFLLKDVKLKMLSFALAIMLWFAISYIGESKVGMLVKVIPQGLKKHLIVTKIEPEEIFVVIKGPTSLLKTLKAKDIQIPLDMTSVREGAQVYYVKRENILVPKDIKVVEIKSDYVVVETDRVIEKRLRTVVKLDRKWRGLYTVKTWKPLYVTVEGARSSLMNRDTIETLPVDNELMAEEERLDAGFDTKDMVVRKMIPDKVSVTLRRH